MKAEAEVPYTECWEQKQDKMIKIALEYKDKYKKCSWLRPIKKYGYYKLWQSANDLIVKSWVKELKQ